jgi:hypothetical protein
MLEGNHRLMSSDFRKEIKEIKWFTKIMEQITHITSFLFYCALIAGATYQIGCGPISSNAILTGASVSHGIQRFPCETSDPDIF